MDDVVDKVKNAALVAKSPSSEKTLLSSSADGGSQPRDGIGGGETASNLLLLVAALHLLTGLLMLAFGVLCAVYDVSLSRLGAGVWGGLVALLAGSLGAAASLDNRQSTNRQSCLSPRSAALYLTLHLAICLVALAVNTLVLLLTLTALVRDARRHLDLLDLDVHLDADKANQWAGQWCAIGLAAATSLQLLCTLVSIPMSCRRACVSPDHHSSDHLIDTKHHLVSSWLGRHESSILPPHLLMEGAPTVYTVPYPHSFTPVGLTHIPTLRPPPLPHHRPYTPRSRSHTPRLMPQDIAEPKKSKRREKQITDEELEKTYTGLDREIAEEFISIAMQSKPPSSHTGSTLSHIIP